MRRGETREELVAKSARHSNQLLFINIAAGFTSDLKQNYRPAYHDPFSHWGRPGLQAKYFQLQPDTTLVGPDLPDDRMLTCSFDPMTPACVAGQVCVLKDIYTTSHNLLAQVFWNESTDPQCSGMTPGIHRQALR